MCFHFCPLLQHNFVVQPLPDNILVELVQNAQNPERAKEQQAALEEVMDMAKKASVLVTGVLPPLYFSPPPPPPPNFLSNPSPIRLFLPSMNSIFDPGHPSSAVPTRQLCGWTRHQSCSQPQPQQQLHRLFQQSRHAKLVTRADANTKFGSALTHAESVRGTPSQLTG